MRRAIALAASALGRTGENPAVGCVLARSGNIVSEGATALGGRPHAEEQALERAGSRAMGATAYVTLEPCASRSGGGTSCAERLAAAGVARVVVAASDPSPFASEAGLQLLRCASVVVETGLLGADTELLYADYHRRLGAKP